MPAANDSDAPVSSALSVMPASPPGSASPASSSEPAASGSPPALEPPADLPPLDPMIASGDHRRAELERLGDRIAELSSRIQAATYDLLVLICEFDARSGWSGCASCAHWLSWRTGLAPGPAREQVRVARALGNLPKLSDAMRRGVVSYSKVRAVTRVATPETEQALLDVALCGTAAHVEQIVRGWRRVDRTAEQTEDRRRAGEAVAANVGGRRRDGGGSGAADTGGGRGAAARAGGGVRPGAVAAGRGGGRRRGRRGVRRGGGGGGAGADVRAAAAGCDRDGGRVRAGRRTGPRDGGRPLSGGAARGRRRAGRTSRTFPRERPRARSSRCIRAGASALASTMQTGTSHPTSGGRQLRRSSQPCPGPNPAAGSAPAACSQTVLDEAGGIHVSAETARRLACDAAKVEMQHGAGGEILDVGRRTRTVSPALRRALAARDRQCRFPGCQNRRNDAHHVKHWRTAGKRRSTTWCCLCRPPHKLHKSFILNDFGSTSRPAFPRLFPNAQRESGGP